MLESACARRCEVGWGRRFNGPATLPPPITPPNHQIIDQMEAPLDRPMEVDLQELQRLIGG